MGPGPLDCYHCALNSGSADVHWRNGVLLRIQDMVLLTEVPKQGYQYLRPSEVQPLGLGHPCVLRPCWDQYHVPGSHLDLRGQLPDAERKCDHIHRYPLRHVLAQQAEVVPVDGDDYGHYGPLRGGCWRLYIRRDVRRVPRQGDDTGGGPTDHPGSRDSSRADDG